MYNPVHHQPRLNPELLHIEGLNRAPRTVSTPTRYVTLSIHAHSSDPLHMPSKNIFKFTLPELCPSCPRVTLHQYSSNQQTPRRSLSQTRKQTEERNYPLPLPSPSRGPPLLCTQSLCRCRPDQGCVRSRHPGAGLPGHASEPGARTAAHRSRHASRHAGSGEAGERGSGKSHIDRIGTLLNRTAGGAPDSTAKSARSSSSAASSTRRSKGRLRTSPCRRQVVGGVRSERWTPLGVKDAHARGRGTSWRFART